MGICNRLPKENIATSAAASSAHALEKQVVNNLLENEVLYNFYKVIC